MAALKWTEERIIDAIHRWVEEYGEPPRAGDWNVGWLRSQGYFNRLKRFNDGDWPHLATLRQRGHPFNWWIKKAGYETRYASQKGVPKAKVEAAIEEFMSTDEPVFELVCKRHHISKDTLRTALAERGINSNRRPWLGTQRKTGSVDARLAKLMRREEKLSYREIGERLGISTSTAHRHVKRAA